MEQANPDGRDQTAAASDVRAEIQRTLDAVIDEVRPLTQTGAVADYIPALACVPRERLAVALHVPDLGEICAGDADVPLSVQSVSKVFILAHALDTLGDALWTRVGREPSGMRFNSMVQLETEAGIPRNPLINAGAIATTDALMDAAPDWPERFPLAMAALGAPTLSAASHAAPEPDIAIDGEVYASERDHGDLNRAIAWFLRAKGNLRCDPTAVTEAYFSACSLAMTTRQLARAGRFLIGPPRAGGDAPSAAAAAAPVNPAAALCAAPGRRRRIRAIMRTCGLYDAAGDFAYRVGLPAKSGVGGAILAINPGAYSVAVWSPALDAKGNSAAGLKALERLVPLLERILLEAARTQARP